MVGNINVNRQSDRQDIAVLMKNLMQYAMNG